MKVLDLVQVCRYTPITKNDINSFGNVPVYSQSIDKIEGYTGNVAKSIQGPAIIFGDHTSTCNYVEGIFCVTPNCKVLKNDKAINCDLYYLYTYVQHKLNRIYTGDYGRHFKIIKEMEIPIHNFNDQVTIGSFP